MVKKLTAKKAEEPKEPAAVKLYALRRPGRHKGKIPAAVIRASVRKVVGERKKREAEAAAGSSSPSVG